MNQTLLERLEISVVENQPEDPKERRQYFELLIQILHQQIVYLQRKIAEC